MPRPRSTARTTSPTFFDSRRDDRYLCPALKEVLDTNDPAVTAITTRVLMARMVGQDTTNADVIARCIAEGRADHAAAQLGGAA